jgi:hypothetical protein
MCEESPTDFITEIVPIYRNVDYGIDMWEELGLV